MPFSGITQLVGALSPDCRLHNNSILNRTLITMSNIAIRFMFEIWGEGGGRRA